MGVVLTTADSERATIFDLGSGVSSTLYATTYPERVPSLMMLNVRDTYPEFRGLSALESQRLALKLRSLGALRG